MNIWNKIKNCIFDRGYRLRVLIKIGVYNNVSDEEMLIKMYKYIMGKTLNLKKPTSFNEKIQWLKLYDRKPEYIKLVDKYSVKEYVASIIGSQYIIPTLGVWDKFSDINFEELPPEFVLKCTHDSGGVWVIKDKKFLKGIKKKVEKCLKVNFYYTSREWPYKYIQPRIIAEKYMGNKSKDLCDYKLMCFNGKVKCIFVCSNRKSESGLNVTFFDLDWKRLPFERKYPVNPNIIERPKTFEEMVILAEKLSKNIPFVRIDFYEIDDKPYFGEITFYPGAGFEKFEPEEWDEVLGSWIKLPIDE